MSGIAMMLKAMGVDPNAIKEQATMVTDTIRDFKQQLDRIEDKLDTIINDKDKDKEFEL